MLTGARIWLGSISVAAALFGCGSADLDGRGPQATGGSSGGSGAGGSGGSGAIAPGNAPDIPEHEGYEVAEGVPDRGAPPPVSGACTLANPDALPSLVSLVPADANAMGSAGLAKESLLAGLAPIPARVRTQELLAHYTPRSPITPTNAPGAVVQLRKSTTVTGLFEMLVLVEAPSMTIEQRPPLALTLVVDTTTSIAPVVDRSVAAINALALGLRSGDTVHWITSALDAPETIAITDPAASGLPERAATLDPSVEEQPEALDALVAAGWATALERHVPGAWNRVIVISDGEGTISTATHDTIRNAALPDQRIHSLVVGVGKTPGPDPRMLRLLSHAGRGPYLHLYDASAPAIEQRFVELVGIVGDGLTVQLDVPWYFEVQRPYLFETTAPGSAEPQYLAPGQALAFPFRLQACDENALVFTDTLDVTIALFDPTTGDPITVTAAPKLADLASGNPTPELDQAFAIVAYADALRTLDPTRLSHARDLASSANLQEIANLLPLHPAFPP